MLKARLVCYKTEEATDGGEDEDPTPAMSYWTWLVPLGYDSRYSTEHEGAWTS